MPQEGFSLVDTMCLGTHVAKAGSKFKVIDIQ